MSFALLGVFFFDELATGVAPADATRIAGDLGVAAGSLAGAVIAAFYGVSFLVEPTLLRWAERWAPRRALGLGLGALVVVLALASAVGSEPALLVLLGLYGPASGLTTSVAEGILVERRPDDRERTLARVHLAGGLGDLAVPVLLALVAWRTYFRIAALVGLVLFVVVARARTLDRRLEGDADDDEPDPPRLRDALRNRALVLWTLVTTLAGTMDEVLAAFLAVSFHARFDGGVEQVALALGIWTAGGLAGLALLDRALARIAPRTALLATSSVAALSFVALLASLPAPAMLAVSFVLGASVSTFHPLVSARAYASLPGHPGVVNAVAAMAVPIDALVPLALGVLVDRSGPASAVVALGAVPALLFLVALGLPRAGYPRA